MRRGSLWTFLLGIVSTGATLTTASPASAGPALLFEAGNGKVLYAEDQDDQWYPASLTKIMTAYITFEEVKAGRLKLDQKIPCSLVANLQPPSKIGLPVGGEMTVETALQALIIKSANDVAVMLAEAVAGSEQAFVAKMNATALRLGMTRSRFTNPNGLPAPDQVTTARDLAKLSNAILTDFPEYAHFWSMPDMRLGKRRLGSHNALLRTFEGADGLKTGFTCDSGFNVVASATRDGKRLMAVVLGEPSGNERALRAASLLEHGFQQYGWKTIFNTTNIDSLPVPPEAKGIISVRESVIAWDCGNRRINIAKRNKELKRKVAAVKARAKAKANQANNKKSSSVLELKGTAIADAPTPAATASTAPKSAATP